MFVTVCVRVCVCGSIDEYVSALYGKRLELPIPFEVATCRDIVVLAGTMNALTAQRL